MFRQIGPTEIMIILGVIVLLFGGRKLPEMARGSGRALRIFKSEIKGLRDDEQSAEEDDTQDSASTDVSKPSESSRQNGVNTSDTSTNEAKRDKG